MAAILQVTDNANGSHTIAVPSESGFVRPPRGSLYGCTLIFDDPTKAPYEVTSNVGAFSFPYLEPYTATIWLKNAITQQKHNVTAPARVAPKALATSSSSSEKQIEAKPIEAKPVGSSPYRISDSLAAAASKSVHWSRTHSGLEELRIFGAEGLASDPLSERYLMQKLLSGLIYGARLYENEATITVPKWSIAHGRVEQLPPAEIAPGIDLMNAGSSVAWEEDGKETSKPSSQNANANANANAMADDSNTNLCAIADRIFKEMATQRRSNTPMTQVEIRSQRDWWRCMAEVQIRELHMKETETGSISHKEGAVLSGSKFWLCDLSTGRYVIATVTDWREIVEIDVLQAGRSLDGSGSDSDEDGFRKRKRKNEDVSELVFTISTPLTAADLTKSSKSADQSSIEGRLRIRSAATYSSFGLIPSEWNFDEKLYNDTIVSIKMGAGIPVKGPSKGFVGSASAMTDVPSKPTALKLAGVSLIHDWISPVNFSDEVAEIITKYLLLKE